MPNAPVSFTVTCSNNSPTKKWNGFLLCFIVLSRFFVPPRLSHKQTQKHFFNPTKFATEKHTSLQMALKEKVIRLICWKGFYYIVRKIRKRIFLLFYVKDLLTTGKNSWKTANSTSKGSTSNPLQAALLTRYCGKAGIKNLSEAYLKPS